MNSNDIVIIGVDRMVKVVLDFKGKISENYQIFAI